MSTPALLADVVDPNWDIREEVGPDIALLYYGSEIRFEHICDRGKRGVIRCSPLLSPGHDVRSKGRRGLPRQTTVSPSILCEDCGTHGHITLGVWGP